MIHLTISMIGILFIATVVFTLPGILTAIALKMRMKRICIFYTWVIYRKVFGETELTIGVLPLGGGIEFYDENLAGYAWYEKVALFSAGIFATGIIGYALTSFNIFQFMTMYFNGITHPDSLGVQYFGQFIDVVRVNPIRGLGLFLIGMSIVNALPLGMCNGGYIILAVAGKYINATWKNIILYTGVVAFGLNFLITMYIIVKWIFV